MEYTKKLLEKYGCSDPAGKTAVLSAYMERILELNREINLTRVTDHDEFEARHFIESLAVCRDDAFVKARRIIDVGSGAGFPGVPLAVAFPEKEVVLVDSLAKRMDIVRELCGELGIKNVTAVHGRAEDLGREEGFREGFDLCVSRAVAELRVLAEYALPFVKTGGTFAAWKGERYREELEAAAAAVDKLGGGETRIIPAAVPERGNNALSGHDAPDLPGGRGVIIMIKKIKETPPAYPRSPGKPAKRPLR